jgi:hypothetical protein
MRRLLRRPYALGFALLALAVLIGALALRAMPSSSVSATTEQAPSPSLHVPLSTPAHPGKIYLSSPAVTATWDESTALVRWQPIAGATRYVVTLIRSRDLAIIERSTVLASQRIFDAQGVWPDEMYQIAIQPVWANDTLGPAEYSAPGRSAPISRQVYNGFLDTETRPQGPVDPNLWFISMSGAHPDGGAFVNDQLHYHLEAGDPEDDQTLATMRARVPMDWSQGTVTIHGEVDLKGTFHNWFAVVLSPQATGPERIIDTNDRRFGARTMPMLELFDDNLGVHLFYAIGNDTPPRELGTPFTHVYNTPNVRDTILWKVNTRHVTVVIDGQTAFDVDLPVPLSFTRSYLTLAAEDYPDNGGVRFTDPCDGVMADCNVWHLDDWGFTAASGSQPTSAVYYAAGCGPYAANEFKLVTFKACAPLDLRGNSQYGRGPGAVVTTTITVSRAAHLIGADVSLEAQMLEQQGELELSVNGGPWVTPAYVANDTDFAYYQDYVIPIDPALLKAGTNTVAIRKAFNPPDNSGFVVANVQIETLSSTPYTPAPPPPETAPKGYWH